MIRKIVSVTALLAVAVSLLYSTAVVRTGDYVCTPAGGTDTYTCTVSSAFSYTTGVIVTFKPDVDNTGTASININGLGAKTLKAGNVSGSTLTDKTVLAGSIYQVYYDGTDFKIMSGPDGAWTGFSYSASWADFGSGFQAGQYRKSANGDVCIRGVLSEGTKTAGTVFITLPAGFRPASPTMVWGMNDNGTNNLIWRLDLNTSGQISPTLTVSSSYMVFNMQCFSTY